MSQRIVHVAVGIVFNQEKHVLVALRPPHAPQGNLWEFPGGKVEAAETVEQALKRELKEEVGISVIAAKPLTQIKHTYPDKTVCLDVWQVTEYWGEAQGLEGQVVRWILPSELLKLDVPLANLEIVNLVIKISA